MYRSNSPVPAPIRNRKPSLHPGNCSRSRGANSHLADPILEPFIGRKNKRNVTKRKKDKWQILGPRRPLVESRPNESRVYTRVQKFVPTVRGIPSLAYFCLSLSLLPPDSRAVTLRRLRDVGAQNHYAADRTAERSKLSKAPKRSTRAEIHRRLSASSIDRPSRGKDQWEITGKLSANLDQMHGPFNVEETDPHLYFKKSPIRVSHPFLDTCRNVLKINSSLSIISLAYFIGTIRKCTFEYMKY